MEYGSTRKFHYFTKETVLRAIGEVKKLLKTSNNIEELRRVANNNTQEKLGKSKVNDSIYKFK
ncbi:hypothetical protein ABSA28_00842 [Candidatus Hepatincolaceae symbiont of Richtersius coronifer]